MKSLGTPLASCRRRAGLAVLFAVAAAASVASPAPQAAAQPLPPVAVLFRGPLVCGPGSPALLLQGTVQPLPPPPVEFADIMVALTVEPGFTATVEVVGTPAGGGPVTLVGAGTVIINPPADLTEVIPGPFNDTIIGFLDGPFVFSIRCTPDAEPPPVEPPPGPPPPPQNTAANPDALVDLTSPFLEPDGLGQAFIDRCRARAGLYAALLQSLNELRAGAPATIARARDAAIARGLSSAQVSLAVQEAELTIQSAESRTVELMAEFRRGCEDFIPDAFAGNRFAPHMPSPVLSADSVMALNQFAGDLPAGYAGPRGHVYVRHTGNAWFDTGAIARSALGGGLLIGAEGLLTDRLTLGFLTQFRIAQGAIPAAGQALNTTGIGLGLYARKTIGSRYLLTGLLFYEHGFNRFTTPAATANFGTDRFGIAFDFSGRWETPAGIVFTPNVAVRYQHLLRAGFTDSAGAALAASVLQLGQVKLGGRAAFPGLLIGRTAVTPYLDAHGVWNFLDTATFTTGGFTFTDNAGITAALGAGLDIQFANAMSAQLGGTVGGLGGDILSVSLNADLQIPLSVFGFGRETGGPLLALGFSAQPLTGDVGGTARLRIPLH